MSAALPPGYQPWIRRACSTALPDGEARATCSSCVMASEPPSSPVPTFDPEFNCCTYVPVLPNHSVGRILAEPVGHLGRRSVVERIHRWEAVTPLGLDWPHDVGELYDDKDVGFGMDRRLRCPHHQTTPDGGRCGIWAHRNATCATWFCRHERGESGRAVWMAIRDLLTAIDRTLTWFAVDELGISDERRELLTDRPGLLRGATLVDGHPGGLPTEDNRRRVWGRWFGRELEFYEACARVVAEADPQALRARVDSATRARVEKLDDALAGLSEPPPRAPVKQRFTTQERPDGTSLVQAYSLYDPVVLPTNVVRALDVFDGAPLQLIHHRLAERGVSWADLDLRQLLDFRLIAAKDPS